MSTTDDPALLDALRRHKQAKRMPFVYRPDAALTPLQQWEMKVRAVLGRALDQADAKRQAARQHGQQVSA